MKQNSNLQSGFGLVESLVVIAAVVLLGVAGWFVYDHNHSTRPFSAKNSKTTKASTQPQSTNTTPKVDPYAGWKTATSPRAGFSIKYPATWTYNETVGSNDNVEHITIDSSHFHFEIDSYSGRDPSNGGEPNTKCPDCLQQTSASSITVPKLGTANMAAVTYKLDAGTGNALILELPDSTYYIPSPDDPNVYTSFRGISLLGSEQAYQAETSSQFLANPDYATAQEILKSLAY